MVEDYSKSLVTMISIVFTHEIQLEHQLKHI